MSENSTTNEHRSGYVAIIGPANAGKSTLLNAILGTKVSMVSAKQQSTRNRVVGVKTLPNGQIVFLDTPGFLARRYRGELARFIGDALSESVAEVDLTMLVLDGRKAVSDANFAKRLSETLEKRKISTPSVVVINKIDLFPPKEVLPVLKQLSDVFGESAKGEQVDLVPVSAQTGEGVDTLQQILLQKLPEGPQFFPEDMVTDQPESFFAAEIVREKVYARLHKELPYSCAVRVEGWEDTPDLLKIQANIMVERDSQKGIVIGNRGATLKSIGTAARHELEKLFRTKVYLELFVRVESDWTKSRKGMAKAGYRSDVPYGDSY